MARKFKTPDYEKTLHQSITLGEALPANHLARFVVRVIAQLDLSKVYAQYAPVGGEAIAPEILLGLLFYGYATGVFSSRKIERATDEIAIRKEWLENLAEAKVILEARAQERYEAEKAEYEAKLREREEKAKRSGRKPRGRQPKPPQAGPRDKDQYNFTDPDSRIMKNSSNDGFDQHYNAQVAVDQESLLIVAPALSNHPNDKQEAEATVDAIPAEVGKPTGAALDNGYFSEDNVAALERRGIEPYIATGREPHHRSWCSFFEALPEPPPEEASLKTKMAYKLQTEIGQAVYRLRKCTVEPVIGIIKEILGFRQFSLRGLWAAAGEWRLVCLAFNLKRLHTLYLAQGLF